MSSVTKSGSNAFAGATASVDIPKPHTRDSGFFADRDSSAVTARSLPARHHAQMLPTPPNSISPSLPPHKFKLQGPASQVDSDIDLQDEATEIQHHGVRPQHGFALPDNESDAAGLDAAGAITPALLAKHHLSEILLAHGPLAIRHVMGYLTTSVPGFSRIPPAKARRLVVGALEGRGNGGENGEFSGDVLFEKVGWGRWDARIKGQPPRENRGIQQSSLIGGDPSPPASVPSSYSIGGFPIPNGAGWMERSRTDQPSTSWAGDSAVFSHDDDIDPTYQEDITMLEHEADKMSLDGDDSCSSSEAPEDGPVLEEELDDITDDEDWAQIGAAALRQGGFPVTAGSGYNYLSNHVHSGDRGGGPSLSALAKSMPSNFIHNPREQPDYVGFSHTASFGVGSNSQEREAIEALVRLSSV
ncbi:MAG: DNA-binding proteins Bright/BRCAA1/RBP1 and proteins containing BRIGHT domain [Trichoglossum hirsutum]|nr:MAG: DNA-binding proteins Bright/BRCAA1/RBP1 and proteins containing BRIGHT domain [Trichoglossum hirsutum]